jgi:hypothetical protein
MSRGGAFLMAFATGRKARPGGENLLENSPLMSRRGLDTATYSGTLRVDHNI